MGTYAKHLYKKYQVSPNMIVECPDEYSIVCSCKGKFRNRTDAKDGYIGAGSGNQYPQFEGTGNLSSGIYVLDERPLPAAGC